MRHMPMPAVCRSPKRSQIQNMTLVMAHACSVIVGWSRLRSVSTAPYRTNGSVSVSNAAMAPVCRMSAAPGTGIRPRAIPRSRAYARPPARRRHLHRSTQVATRQSNVLIPKSRVRLHGGTVALVPMYDSDSCAGMNCVRLTNRLFPS